MQTNLKEASTAPCAAAINTGCNTWLNTSPGDIGSWGYYNTTTTNGTAGWQSSTEPGFNEGYLYQWRGAMDATISERSRGICPLGFHIPSDCEWMYLEHGLGMSITEQNRVNDWRSSLTTLQGTPGRKIRSQGIGQTNVSGFSGLLTGFRSTNGSFFRRATEDGYFWSSTSFSALNAYYRFIYNGQMGIRRVNENPKALSFSVRCLKD